MSSVYLLLLLFLYMLSLRIKNNFLYFSKIKKPRQKSRLFWYIPSKSHTALKDTYLLHFLQASFQPLPFWISPRPISDSQLHTSLYFHLCPIYLVVFKGSYYLRMGYLILRGASRLDAFSVYPFPTWLLGHALGRTTDTPEVSPSRSSRTKDSSSQISYAHAG